MNLYKYTIWSFFLLLVFSISLISCKKDWLGVRPNKNLVVPSTVEDYQSLLDNTYSFNINGGLGNTEVASGDHSVSYAVWQSVGSIEQGAYIWAKDPYLGKSVNDWTNAYNRILQDNIVLDGLEKITFINAAHNNVKGAALFYRAYDFFTIAQQFCPSFSSKSANDELGIPLRLTANVNDKAVRATVAETYNQVIEDLKASRYLLPQTPLYKTRPSIPAVYAMLSRVYLSMEDYDNAGLYADSCLQVYNKLIDYNTLNISAARPFAQFNDETIFEWQMTTYTTVRTGTIVSELYQSYDSNDLRLSAFFTASQVFKGSYTGTSALFNGLATNEVFLIRAECRARANKVMPAIEDLNSLMVKRWNKNIPYPKFSATDADDALTQILTERRKELVYRGLRWSDLRRLNKDIRFSKILSRNLNGVIYTLKPNDSRYVFPIPPDEILLSGIQQNSH